MKNSKLKQHLSICKRKNDPGFTVIELLISLSLMTFFLLITLPIWNTLQHQSQAERFSVYQFFHIATDEVQKNDVIEGAKNRLVMQTINDDQVILSRYNDTIRRRVNQTGHEILLRNINSFEVIQNHDHLKINLIMKSGNQYEKVIIAGLCR